MLPVRLSVLTLIALCCHIGTAQGSSTFSSGDYTAIVDGGVARSTIFVPNLSGPIEEVTVRLDGLSHDSPDDLDIALVAPSGHAVALVSDACGTFALSQAAVTFADNGAATLTDNGPCTNASATRPTTFAPSDTWNLPRGTPAATLSALNGLPARGLWTLVIIDDAPGSSGDLDDWTLTLTTGTSTVQIPATETNGPASAYPSAQSVSGREGVIRDVSVTLDGLTHTYPDDLDALLVAPSGQAVTLLSDTCGSQALINVTWRFSDGASATLPDGSGASCALVPHRISLFDAASDSFPDPAPKGPYATTLTSLRGSEANGLWRLFLVDDAPGDIGFLLRGWQVEVTTRATHLVNSEITAAEGSTAEVTIRRTGSAPAESGSVRVRTAADTADATDFAPVDRTVTFAAGDLAQTVAIPIAADGQTGESAERFRVTLSSPSGDVALTGPSVATVTIPADRTSGAGVTPPRPPALRGTMIRFPSNRTCRKPRAQIRVTFRVPTGITLTGSTAKINGRTVATAQGSRALKVRLPRRGLPAVTVTMRDTRGRTASALARYRICR